MMYEGMEVKDVCSFSRNAAFGKALGIEILITGSPVRMT